MDPWVLAHDCDPTPQSGFRRHAVDPKSFSEVLVFPELADMVKVDLADGDEPAQAAKDVLFSDQVA